MKSILLFDYSLFERERKREEKERKSNRERKRERARETVEYIQLNDVSYFHAILNLDPKLLFAFTLNKSRYSIFQKYIVIMNGWKYLEEIMCYFHFQMYILLASTFSYFNVGLKIYVVYT